MEKGAAFVEMDVNRVFRINAPAGGNGKVDLSAITIAHRRAPRIISASLSPNHAKRRATRLSYIACNISRFILPHWAKLPDKYSTVKFDPNSHFTILNTFQYMHHLHHRHQPGFYPSPRAPAELLSPASFALVCAVEDGFNTGPALGDAHEREATVEAWEVRQ